MEDSDINCMDDIIEFIVELVLDIFVEVGMNQKMPKWLRIVVLLILLLVFGGMIGTFLYISYEALQKGDRIASLVAFIIAIALGIFLVWGFWSKYREINQKNKKK